MRRRGAIALLVVAALLLVALLALRWAMRPETLGPRVLHMAGQALGLEIAAEEFDYRLRGSPQLVARGVAAREPGTDAPLLRAERALVSLPWSTLRARGAVLDITRVELDAPHLDLAAFQRWWTQRPPGDGRLPTLREGLRIDRGRIDGDGWTLQDLAVELPHFAPDAPLRAGVRGTWHTDALQAPFDLHLAMTRPAGDAGIGIAGTATPAGDGWRLPSRLLLSTRLVTAAATSPATGDPVTRLRGLRLSTRARYLSGDTMQPFVLGLAVEGRLAGTALHLEPASAVLRGQGVLPHLRARGSIAFDQALRLDLAGELARWPEAWPALPPPLGESDAPLPFALRYHGAANLADPLDLRLQRGEADFEGRLRTVELAAWIADADTGSPLPPLDGRLRAPRIEVSGATLHGVEIFLQDDPSDEIDPP